MTLLFEKVGHIKCCEKLNKLKVCHAENFRKRVGFIL